ncbi:MAG: cyclic nucleotide-binding domain-containing protein [Candidatus Mcinerneyibacterium aminivorans]|uniref:Cyclic nucleotide-binding domain-containing protein n=1 Tax=Candidatus Mcinerneyibacterium aminivorans TaxID=2703815 RepID=A0A5D0MKK7_9BACT|nr:MAG: cyclic nucleotide-binding domain-containing protein [Candidatus Mcinerneyibacterium aminivorans]
MIEKYYLFEELGKQESATIEKRLFLKHYDKKTIIFEEDDIVDSIYFIEQGEVEIYKKVSGEKQQHIINLSKGEFFGEIGTLNDNKRFANAKAKTDVQALVLLKSDFERILKNDRNIRYKIYKNFLNEMIKRLRLSDTKFKKFFRTVLRGN